MGAIFGSLSALSIGLTELYGRRVVALSSVLTAAWVMQILAAVTALLCAFVLPGDWVWEDGGRGVLSGCGIAVGLGAYFGGLRRSSATVMAPILGTLVAVVPYSYAMVRGAEASGLAVLGATVAIVGLVLIGLGTINVADLRSGIVWGTLSGLGYGGSIAVLVENSEASGAWPVVAQRTTAMAALGLAVVLTRSQLIPPAASRRSSLAAGLFGGLSSVLVILGLNADAPSAIVTASMFPAASVVVGFVFFSDAVSRRQASGLALALVGIALVVGA